MGMWEGSQRKHFLHPSGFGYVIEYVTHLPKPKGVCKRLFWAQRCKDGGIHYPTICKASSYDEQELHDIVDGYIENYLKLKMVYRTQNQEDKVKISLFEFYKRKGNYVIDASYGGVQWLNPPNNAG